MKQCLNLSFYNNKDDEAKIKFFEKAIKENKIDGSFTYNGYQYELNCVSTESCKCCDFEEHCYFDIRKLSKEQFIMLADKFQEIKKVNTSDIKFGSVVKLQTRLLKIKESKLIRLRAFYGKCLSERQIQEIKNDLYINDEEDEDLYIEYNDLETTGERIHIGLISGISKPFGYYFTEYSEHNKEFIGNNIQCIHYVHKPSIRLDKAGKDFEDYFTWTTSEIIEILSPEERQKYLEKQKDFYSLINF